MSNPGLYSTLRHETFRFLRKDSRKIAPIVGLYASTLFQPSTGRTALSTYFFLRHIDDLLDGEMAPDNTNEELRKNPIPYVQRLKDHVLNGEFDTSTPIGRIGAYAIENLDKKGRHEDEPRTTVASIIDTMVFDHRRRLNRQALDTTTLHEYYRLTFNSCLDVMLLGMGSATRSNDVPEFGLSQGRLYSIRDIQKDFALGIINVPSEVIFASSVGPDSSIGSILQDPTIREWATQEIAEGREGMRKSFTIMPEVSELSTRVIVKMLARGAMKGPFFVTAQ